MSEILIESLGTSRYAPVNINAYQYNGLAGLSFGQLIMAVCCRRAAAIESQSVIKMNQLTQTTDFLNEASAVTARMFTASSVSEADKIFMEKEMGVEESDIDISTGIYITCAMILVILIGLAVFFAIRKRIRNIY